MKRGVGAGGKVNTRQTMQLPTCCSPPRLSVGHANTHTSSAHTQIYSHTLAHTHMQTLASFKHNYHHRHVLIIGKSSLTWRLVLLFRLDDASDLCCFASLYACLPLSLSLCYAKHNFVRSVSGEAAVSSSQP